MSKDKIADYDGSTAGNNTDIGGISIAEGMLPSAVNNSMRELTKQLGAFADGTDGIDVLNLHDDDASASIKIQAPATVTTTTTLTLPDGDGDAGAMLQTNGSGQLAWSTAYRNRNLILNGGMAISQRGISHPALSGYGLDRFKASSSSDGAVTVTQSTTVPSGEGFKNSMKFDVTTADTSLSASQYYQFFQPIEGQNLAHLMFGTSDAKSVTLSFWCRSNKTGTYVTTFMNSAADRFNPNNFTISSANTWEKKTITVTGDQSGTWLTTNGIGMYVIWNLALGSDFDDGTNGTWGAGDYGSGGNVNFLDSTSNEFYITGVQLEIGSQSTPFEHRSYGEELALCQRYYQTMARGAMGGAYSSTQWIGGGNFNTPMRATPTASQPSGVATVHDPSTATFAQSSTNITATYASTTGSTFILGNLSGMTAYRPMSLFGGQIDFSAEL